MTATWLVTFVLGVFIQAGVLFLALLWARKRGVLVDSPMVRGAPASDTESVRKFFIAGRYSVVTSGAIQYPLRMYFVTRKTTEQIGWTVGRSNGPVGTNAGHQYEKTWEAA